jgi:UDP-glucose-4-epimerase GalE
MSEKKKQVLVTGGAGYIGSHTAKALAARGFVPVTYDNLVNGHRWAVRWGPFVHGDIADKTRLLQVIEQYQISAVIHFAAFAYVGDSMKQPGIYFENNVSKSLTLLDAIIESDIRHFVFSSSCATYGTPVQMPIREVTRQQPVNPYGETKLILEQALRWYGDVYKLSWAALRYFNAAGADPDCEIGEAHYPETHLIPLILEAAKTGGIVDVFGSDYPTPDGTCVRDYIHVSDLADAHVRMLVNLMEGGKSIKLNLGTGQGHSVNEVIAMVELITGREVNRRVGPRRMGDPAILVADPSLAQEVLAWRPAHSSLESIISSAWRWHIRDVKHSDRLLQPAIVGTNNVSIMSGKGETETLSAAVSSHVMGD